MVEYHDHDSVNSPHINLKFQRGFPVLETIPDFEAKDGQISFVAGNPDRIYARMNGEWVNMNPVPSNFEQTVTLVGSASVGDALFQLPASTNSLIYRIESTNGMSTSAFGYNAARQRAFRFKAPVSFTLKSIKIHLWATGSPADSVRVALYSNTGSEPGSSLQSALQAATTTPTEYTISFNQALTANTYYWIVVDRTGATDPLNYYNTYQNNTTDIQASTTYHPDSTVKVYNGTSWASSGEMGRYALYGDVEAGYHKWYGLRTNLNCGSVGGVVKSVDGSSATIVTQGYMSGLSGLTAASIYSISNLYVGLALSTTELFVFSRKYFTLSSRAFNGSVGINLNLPVAFSYTTRAITGGTLAAGTGAEYINTLTSTTSSFSLTNEYTSLT
jgi:hypothetical protein